MDIWKTFHKIVFTREQIEGKNELINLPGNNRISSKADALPGQLISIISRDLLPEPRSSYFSDLLPFDNISKMICHYIYLLLLLNQL